MSMDQFEELRKLDREDFLAALREMDSESVERFRLETRKENERLFREIMEKIKKLQER